MTKKTIADYLSKWCRAEGICRWCGSQSDNLEAHHILTKGAYPELALCPLNLYPLCLTCHLKVHADRMVFFRFINNLSPGYTEWLVCIVSRAWRKLDRDGVWEMAKDLPTWSELFEAMKEPGIRVKPESIMSR